jgi:hypothetical protein
MYSIQFGTRAGFVDEANAQIVLKAIREDARFVTVAVDVANDGGEPYEVTINVAHIVSLMKHRARPLLAAPGEPRAHLSVVS